MNKSIHIFSIFGLILVAGCFSGKPLRESIPEKTRDEFRSSIEGLIVKSKWREICSITKQYEHQRNDSYANYITGECLLRGFSTATHELRLKLKGLNLQNFNTREERNGIISLINAASCGEEDALIVLKSRGINLEIPSRSGCNTFQPPATKLTKHARGVTAILSPALIIPAIPVAIIKNEIDDAKEKLPEQKLEEASPLGPKTIVEFPPQSLFKEIGSRNIDYERSTFNAVPGLTTLSFSIPRPLNLQWMKIVPDLSESQVSRINKTLPTCRFAFQLPVNGQIILSYSKSGKDSENREVFRCEIIDKQTSNRLYIINAIYE